MKIRKSKFIIGSLLSVLSVGVVGSVASTYAWYTYNTKDTVAYEGVASANTENLQIKLYDHDEDEWGSDLTSLQLTTESKNNGYAGSELSPVSLMKTYAKDGSKGFKKDDVLEDNNFIGMPTYLNSAISKTGTIDAAGNFNWFKVSFELRCIDPNDDEVGYAQDVYISYLNMKMTVSGKDITNAVRIHIQNGTKGYLISPGESTDNNINLFGSLDLNKDGEKDAGYLETGTTQYWPTPISGLTSTDITDPIIYGTQDAVETYYSKDSFIGKFVNGRHSEGGVPICTTNEDRSSTVVTMTIFLEGWASQMVDAGAGAEFSIAMMLQCDIL